MNNSDVVSTDQRSTMISAARIRLMAGVSALVAVAAALSTIASCSGDDGTSPRAVSTNYDVDAGPKPDADIDETGQACIEGSERKCKVTLGEVNGVITCVEGTRTCVDGIWGPCVGSFSARDSSEEPSSSKATIPHVRTEPSNVVPFSISYPGECTNNPCDPYCAVYVETPVDGYEVVPYIESIYYTGSLKDAIKLTPPGFMNKGLKTPCATTLDCQFDMHCLPSGSNDTDCGVGIANCCMPWESNEFDDSCSLPDPTTGFACTEKVNGKLKPVIPVCNRGSVNIPPGIPIFVFPGDSTQFPLCQPDKNPQICATTVEIEPGKCINVPNCPGLTGNGTKSIMVNPPYDGSAQQPPTVGKSVAECTCENDWGVWSGNNTPCYENYNYAADTIVKSQIYQAICPSGTHPQWGYLTWDATTPSDSRVVFEARVAPTEATLAAASFVTLGTAKALPLPDTQLCLASGPEPCPINLYSAFDGIPKAHYDYLELLISLYGSTDEMDGSKLNSWQITYSCPPSE